MQNVSVSPMSRENIRQLVKEFRQLFGLGDVLYFPIVRFIEWCLPQLGLNYEILTVEEMSNTYGLTNTKRNVLYIREDVYCGAIEGNQETDLLYVMNWGISCYILLTGLALHEVKFRHTEIRNGKLMHSLENSWHHII